MVTLRSLIVRNSTVGWRLVGKVMLAPQGGGKSTFCRLLLPTGRQGGIRAWFSDSVDLAESTQKQVEAIGPALIVEYSEVAGLEAAKRERLKAYLSRQDDRYRPPYFTYAVTIPRRWIGVGTANDTGQGLLPSDLTGYRRYVAISVSRPGPASVRHYMETNRDQLWAEAIAAYKTNESHWPPEHLEKEREETNLTFARVNEVLEDKLSALTERHAGGSPVSLADLMIEAGLVRGSVEASQDVPMQRSIARHLRKSGWGRRETAYRIRRSKRRAPLAETLGIALRYGFHRLDRRFPQLYPTNTLQDLGMMWKSPSSPTGRRDVWLLQSTPERYHGIARPSSPPGVRTLRRPCC